MRRLYKIVKAAVCVNVKELSIGNTAWQMNKYLPSMESDTYVSVSALLPFNEALSSIRSHGYRNVAAVAVVEC